MIRPALVALTSVAALALAACSTPSRPNAAVDAGSGSSGSAACAPGQVEPCYDGHAGQGVGPCHSGTTTCQADGTWGACAGEVVPVGEICGDGIDNNCNGLVDEDIDADGDGWTTCGGDCCDSTECADPVHVNPGAFDAPGDHVDNDCDGVVDEAPVTCDQGLPIGSTVGSDYAKAMDLCQTATLTGSDWGLVDATFTYADGTGLPDAQQHAILGTYGTGVGPRAGRSLALFSTGVAAGVGDPGFTPTLSTQFGTTSGFPSDFFGANHHALPNAPGCAAPNGNAAHDPIMLTMRIRVPTNARAFSLDINFFSDEFPEYTCTPFNDFFVLLLDSSYSGTPANPTDKNLAIYTDMTGKTFPVGVNLASGNTGLFTQCVNGAVGCADGSHGSITTCTGTSELAGTGLDASSPFACDSNSLMGGGTGWLTTSGNVTPGELITLRMAIWDTSDDQLDSLVVLDNFRWSAVPATPGTVIQ